MCVCSIYIYIYIYIAITQGRGPSHISQHDAPAWLRNVHTAHAQCRGGVVSSTRVLFAFSPPKPKTSLASGLLFSHTPHAGAPALLAYVHIGHSHSLPPGVASVPCASATASVVLCRTTPAPADHSRD